MPRLRTILVLSFVLSACGSTPSAPEGVIPPTTQRSTPTLEAPTPIAEQTLPTAEPTLPAPTDAPVESATPSQTTIVAAGRVSQATLGDPYYPELGNGGYDVDHYAIGLDVDVERNVVSGTTTISSRAVVELSAFNLDWEGPQPEVVTVDGVPTETGTSDGEPTITPATPIPGGSTFTTTVTFRGTPELVRSPAVSTPLGWTHYDEGVYVVSEPSGASGWFPANDHPRDKATFTFRITVPDPWIVAANGLLRETLDHGTTRTFVWETTSPMATYLATVNIGNFVVTEENGPNGLPIRNYFPGSIAEPSRAVFAPTAEMLGYFETVFGPYPFEAYGVVVPDKELGFALETQTLSVFGRDIATARPERVEHIVAHELAHQWFGNSVSVENWEDIWLNEGFATFGEWLWQEHKVGREAADETIRRTYASFVERSTPPPGRPPATNLFNQGVYGRGGLALAALRLEIGDERFFQILRTNAERFQYGNASTAEFIAVAEEVSGTELDAFFEGWLYGADLPPIPALGLSRQG